MSNTSVNVTNFGDIRIVRATWLPSERKLRVRLQIPEARHAKRDVSNVVNGLHNSQIAFFEESGQVAVVDILMPGQPICFNVDSPYMCSLTAAMNEQFDRSWRNARHTG